MRNYSLGMRQRLGIAHALLGDPTVLILDEPANGLDPAGIRWMRGLLKGYADRGGTVLLSSHLLHEVEQIADEMILIGNGRIVARGTREELLARRDRRSDDDPGHRARQPRSSTEALTAKGLTVRPAGAGLRVDAEPVEVGRVAAEQRDRAHRPARRATRAASRTCSSSSPPTPSATPCRTRPPSEVPA